jgi:hypothetical protein
MEENATTKPLNRAMLAWFGSHLLSKPEDAKDAVTVAASDLKQSFASSSPSTPSTIQPTP